MSRKKKKITSQDILKIVAYISTILWTLSQTVDKVIDIIKKLS